MNSGTSVASFTLACDKDFTNQQGERETDFMDCVAWKQTAEFVSKYFFKGQMAVVDGRLQARTYTAQDGTKRKVTEVVVSNIYFCGPKQDNGGQQPRTSVYGPLSQQQHQQQAPAPPTQTGFQFSNQNDDDDDELPF